MDIVICLFTLLILSCSAAANVVGIDFGSDYVKAAGPRNGNTVDIVLNEQSLRKTDNYIGFRNTERYIGDQAKSLAARFPTNMVTMTNQLIGLSYNSTEFEDFKKLECEFKTLQTERNTVAFPFGDQIGTFTVEELYAMMLQYCRDISEKDGVQNPKNVVITIPFHSSLAKRQAVLEAARIVDLNVLGLMHSTTAAAFYYGVRRRGFENKTVRLLIYDIGSTHTEVGIYKFSPPVQQNGKKAKTTESFGTLTTLSVVDDNLLNGRMFDLCLARFIEAEAMKKMKIPSVIGGTSILQRKSQFSLLRAAKKAREVLSANTKTPITVEGIVPDRDFSTSITRNDFEEKCADLFQRVPKVAEEAIAKSGLNIKDIDAFEMMGGASRTPKIITDLSAFLGREVDRTLNSDEAAAIGAAYYALRLSPSYRVRSFAVEEHIPFTFFMLLKPELNNTTAARRLLAVNPAIGSQKSITLNRTDDFIIQLVGSHDDDIIGEVLVEGVKEALKDMGMFSPLIIHPNNTHIVRIQLRLNESGLFEVEQAEAIYRYAINTTVKVKVNTSTNVTNTSLNEGYEYVNQIVMKRRIRPLSTTVRFLNPSPLPEAVLIQYKNNIEKLREKEREMHEAATAKNNLETYAFWVKSDGILENITAKSLYSAEHLDLIKTKLLEIQEWLEEREGDYDTRTKDEYEKKMNELKEAVRQKMTVDVVPESNESPRKEDL